MEKPKHSRMIVSRKMCCLLRKTYRKNKVYFNIIVLVNYWAWGTHSHRVNSVKIKKLNIF